MDAKMLKDEIESWMEKLWDEMQALHAGGVYETDDGLDWMLLVYATYTSLCTAVTTAKRMTKLGGKKGGIEQCK